MQAFKKIFLLLFLILIFPTAHGAVNYPTLGGYINDLANIITPDVKMQPINIITQFKNLQGASVFDSGKHVIASPQKQCNLFTKEPKNSNNT